MKKIAVWHQTEPLLPRVVARQEMLVDIVIRPQRHAHAAEQQSLHFLGLLAAQPKNIHAEQHAFPARDGVGKLRRNIATQPVGHGILGRSRDDVRGRALQHGHMRGPLCEFRQQRDCRGTAADHDHALIGVFDVVRPLLRMHDASGEFLYTGKIGRVACLVAVVAGAHEEKIAAEANRRFRLAHLCLNRPSCISRRPRCVLDLMTETDVPINAALMRGVLHVLEN